MYLDAVKAWFEAVDVEDSRQAKPCTEEEVRSLEKDLGLPLPAVYKEFLLWMGHRAGKLLRGEDCFYESIRAIQQGAVELLEENGNPEVLPEDALVFCMHQGYHFYFMCVSEGDNPRIYHYSEVDKPRRFTVSYHNLAEFLRSSIEERLKYLATYGKNAP